MSKMLWSLAIVALLLGGSVVAGEPPVGGPVAETEETFDRPKAGKVNARTLNVRAGPSVDRARITALKRGRSVTVVGRKGKWLKIELAADISLWIMAKFVTLPEGQALPAAGTVNARNVRLRGGGHNKAPILRTLDLDTQLAVVEKKGDWLRVKAPAGTHAWVYGTYITLDGGAPVVIPDKPVIDPPPTPVDDPPKRVVVSPDDPGVKAFSQAETAYRRALAQKNPDLVAVFLLYHEVHQIKGLPAVVKTTCAARMSDIAKRLPDAQKKLISAKVKSGVQAEIDAIKRATAAAIDVLPKIAPRYVARGFLDKAPDIAGIPGTHKLSTSGVLLYYLRAVGPDVDLDKMVGRKVGVTGRKRFVKGWGVQVIDVTLVGDFKNPPTSKTRFEVMKK